MSALVIIVWAIILSFFAIQILALVALNDSRHGQKHEFDEWPMVSILLAARNEEKLIIRSLKALDNIDYPIDKIEILIGDDDSDDRTSDLVKEFIKDKAKFSLHHITEIMGNGRGKANVLAHLAHKAKGEFYFVTDVDVKLPSAWVKDMLSGFEPKVGILSGTTMCERKSNLFAMLQSIDWLHFMGYIKSFANWGIACTSVGNNMAVRAEAYWQTGGFEKIEFSITEDYKLFEAVTKAKWEWRTLLSADSLGKAHHIPNVLEMLHQRKRWLIGAKDLPLTWKSLIVLYGMFLPALLILAIMNLKMAFIVWAFKFFFQSIFIFGLTTKVKEKPFGLAKLLVYEVYVVLNTISTAVFYFLPFASKWKGRTYSKANIA